MKYRSLTEEIKLLELGLPPQEDDWWKFRPKRG
jgi:hypothetical protein